MGLQEDRTRSFLTPGPPRDLVQQLVGSFRRPKVAARQPEISVNHAHSGEHREMVPLGHHLGANDDIDLAGLDRADELRRQAGAGKRIA